MFQGILLTQQDGVTQAQVTTIDESQLPPDEVGVAVGWSCLNYKDGLAITGKGPVVRQWPMVPGIDLAGTVTDSRHPDWKPGDQVVVTGWGMGETRWGGLAQRARLPAGMLLALPEGIDARTAMVHGTAGVTAALCVQALLRHGLTPDQGEVLVTGAAGGVGSVAVALLASLGYTVVASTGRPHEAAYLQALGAARLIDRATLAAPGKPLQKEVWAGVVDTVGSHTLANACAQTRQEGAVAACGLAQGADLPSTVMPFILRGVCLLGVNSVTQPNTRRAEAWRLLADHVKPAHLAQITHEIGLDQVVPVAHQVLAGQVRGRTVVRIPAA